MKVGGGGGEGRKPSLLPHHLPALLLASFFARSLTLAPRSLLLNRTETLATQAINTVEPRFTDTHLIQTPRYYVQFALPLGKESPFIIVHFL